MKRFIIFLLLLLGMLGVSNAQQGEIDYTGLSKREERHLRRLYKDYDYKYGKRGYFGQVSVDATYYVLSSYYPRKTMVGMDVVNGFSFGPHFDLGAGAGFYYMPNTNATKPYCSVPLFAYSRVTFMQRRVTPYIAAKLGLGYAWDTDRSNHHGCLVSEGVSVYAAAEAGVKVHLDSGMALTAGLSTSFMPYSCGSLGVNIGFTW